uniref:Guanylate kinase-like domain-containing protein n=1 Tax=Caenorhabditis tropicalis TaxID=1561998 RepID=A0A1I7U2T2_9PELO
MVEIAWQSTILVASPSGQGKSTLPRKIVEQRNEIHDASSKICFWNYDTVENVPDSIMKEYYAPRMTAES